jgi:hypothetical protein
MSKSPADSHTSERSTSLSLAKSMELDNEVEAYRAPSLQTEIDDIVGALGGLRLVPRKKELEAGTTSKPQIMNIEESTEISLLSKEDDQATTAEKAKAPNKQHERMIAETIERMQEGVKDGEWEMLYRSDGSESAEEDKDTVIISKTEREEATMAAETPAQNSYVNKLKTSMWSAWERWR